MDLFLLRGDFGHGVIEGDVADIPAVDQVSSPGSFTPRLSQNRT